MAHPDYIAAAKQGNRVPTVFMKVESADGDTLYYTTQGDWQGSDTLANINMTEEPGSVINERFNLVFNLPDPPAGEIEIINTPWKFVDGDAISVNTASLVVHPVNDVYLNYLNADVTWPASLGINLKIRVLVRDLVENPTIEHITNEQTITGIIAGVGKTDISLVGTPVVSSGLTRYVIVQGFDTVLNKWFNLTQLAVGGVNTTTLDYIKPTSQLVTSPIEFSDITTSNPVFSVDDITETGATVSYSYEYSDAGSVYTPGGSIVDGDSLVASRFYKITADFTTTTGGRGKIREIQLEEGLFLFFGSHINEPFSGVSPQLVPNSVSGFSQKISIGKGLSTTGQSTVKMFWVPETSDLIASGYLKGQDVSIYSGFKGLSTQAYEPVIVGTWFDHSLDEVAGEITVKVQDAFKQFEKRKIPEEVSDPGTGEIDTSSTANDITFTATSLVTAQKEVFDQIGLRGRYISPDFDTLEAGDYAASKYKVSRVIHKPTEASKLLDELAQTGSMFLIPLGNGQIKPKPFDINQEHTAELDANHIDFVNLEGNLDKFFTRFNSYYNPKTTLTAEPRDDRDDFDNGVALLDSNAELRWFPEKGIKEHFDKWKVGRAAPATPLTSPPQALIDKNVLDNALLTEPLYTMTAKEMGPRFADIEPADVVQVNNLELPVVNNAWAIGPIYANKSRDISAQETVPSGSFFTPDGSRMFISGLNTASVYEYDLADNWDVSTAVYNSVSKFVGTESSTPTSITFKNDGLKMYIIDTTLGRIHQYGLTSAFDLSTASYDSIFADISTEDSTMFGLSFSIDGLNVFTTGYQNSKIYQYTMSAAWDLTTLSYSSKSFSVSGQDSQPSGITFNISGSRCFVVGANSGFVYQYDLSTALDLSTISYNSVNLDISTQDTTPGPIFFDNSGFNFFVTGNDTDTVYKYTIIDKFELGTTEYTEGDRVIHDGKMWRARQDSTGKDPTSEAAFWQDTEILENGLTDGKHFFVLGRKFNPNTALIELDFMEMPPGTLGGFDSGFSSGFDI